MRTQQDFILGHTRSSCCCSMVYKCDFICLPQLQLPPLLPHGIQVTSIRRGHSDLLLTECGSGVLRPAFLGHPVQFCETERMKQRAGTWLYLPALLLTAAYHLQGICSVLASGRWPLNVSSRAHWGPRGTGLEAQAGVIHKQLLGNIVLSIWIAACYLTTGYIVVTERTSESIFPNTNTCNTEIRQLLPNVLTIWTVACHFPYFTLPVPFANQKSESCYQFSGLRPSPSLWYWISIIYWNTSSVCVFKSTDLNSSKQKVSSFLISFF